MRVTWTKAVSDTVNVLALATAGMGAVALGSRLAGSSARALGEGTHPALASGLLALGLALVLPSRARALAASVAALLGAAGLVAAGTRGVAAGAASLGGSPAGALCLLCLGAAALILARPPRARLSITAAAALGATTAAITGTVLVARLVLLHPSSAQTPDVPVIGATALFLGAHAIMIAAAARAATLRGRLPRWLAPLAGLAVASVAVGTWQAMAAAAHVQAARALDYEREEVTHSLNRWIAHEVAWLERIAGVLAQDERDAGNHAALRNPCALLPSGSEWMALAAVDPTGAPAGGPAPPTAGDVPADWLTPGNLALLDTTWSRGTTLACGAPALVVTLPLRHGGDRTSHLVGLLDLARVLDEITRMRRPHGFAFALQRSAGSGTAGGAELAWVDSGWELVGRGGHADDAAGVRAAHLSLAFGLLLSVLVSLLLHLAIRVRARAKEIQLINAELEHRVALRTRQIDAARVSLQRELQDRRAAEAELRASEARFQDLYDRAPDMFATIGLDSHRLRECNATFSRAVARDVAAMTDRDARTLFAPCDRPRLEAAIAELSASGTLRGLELDLLASDGRTIPVSVTASVQDERDGREPEGRFVLRDITAWRELHQQLLQSQKLEAVGRLAGGIAHDFNNMLMIVNWNADLLLATATPGTELHQGLEEIKSASERAANLTRQLLAFSRKQILRPEVLDLGDQVRELEKMLRRLIGPTIELVVRLGEPRGRVTADPVHVQQVLVNLVINARDAMPSGGTITIEVGQTVLGPTHASDDLPAGSYETLTVRDTGTGMDAATRAKVFEPFFSTKSVDRGTGLGLSTVYGIVKQSGGHVEVTSAPGAGSTFTVHLPSTSESPHVASDEPAPRTQARRASGHVVLLVEDEAVIRRLLRVVLEKAGYAVVEASNGVEALSRFGDGGEGIDIVLTDVLMPRMSGIELAHGLLARRPDVPVVLVSGHSEVTATETLRRSPRVAFLDKPCPEAHLLSTLRVMLGERDDGSVRRRAA